MDKFENLDPEEAIRTVAQRGRNSFDDNLDDDKLTMDRIAENVRQDQSLFERYTR